MTQELDRNSIKEKCELWPIGNTMQLTAVGSCVTIIGKACSSLQILVD